MDTLAFFLDYDGCFAGDVQREGREFYISGPIFRHMLSKIEELNIKNIVITSFSNRQDFYTDYMNSTRHKSISSFRALEALAKSLKAKVSNLKVTLDSFLLADAIAQKPAGTTWKAALQYLPTISSELTPRQINQLALPLKTIAFGHEHKVDLLYVKAHRLANMVGPGSHAHIVVYDDRVDILGSLYNTYSKMPAGCALLPKNISIELFAYCALPGEKRAQYLALSPLPQYEEVASTYDDSTPKIPLWHGQKTIVPKLLTEETKVLPGADYGVPEFYEGLIFGSGKINPQGQNMNLNLSILGGQDDSWTAVNSLHECVNRLKQTHNQQINTLKATCKNVTWGGVDQRVWYRQKKLANPFNSLLCQPSMPKFPV